MSQPRKRRVTLRELHERTGTLIREATAAGYSVVVTDRGRPLATIVPYDADADRHRFVDRELSGPFAALQRKRVTTDSTVGISEDRDRE